MSIAEGHRPIEGQVQLSPLELIRSGEKVERLEVIPIQNITSESSIVDDHHATQLGESMSQERGQITPIAVRAREENGRVIYDVIDGFHRTAALRKLKKESINATVVYNCDDQELFDLRILAANSVQTVQFARVAEWISQSFAKTEWSSRGLPVARAFGTAMSNAQQIKGYDFSPQEVDSIKDWVTERCSKWGKNIGSTYADLNLIGNADPKLVRQVRLGTGGRDRAKLITPDRLRMVVNAFPGEENYELQNILLYYAVDRKLYKPELAELVSFVKGKLDDETTYEGLIDLLDSEIKRIESNPDRDKKKIADFRVEMRELRRENKDLRQSLQTAQEEANRYRYRANQLESSFEHERKTAATLRADNNRLIQDVVPELRREIEALKKGSTTVVVVDQPKQTEPIPSEINSEVLKVDRNGNTEETPNNATKVIVSFEPPFSENGKVEVQEKDDANTIIERCAMVLSFLGRHKDMIAIERKTHFDEDSTERVYLLYDEIVDVNKRKSDDAVRLMQIEALEYFKRVISEGLETDETLPQEITALMKYVKNKLGREFINTALVVARSEHAQFLKNRNSPIRSGT